VWPAGGLSSQFQRPAGSRDVEAEKKNRFHIYVLVNLGKIELI
jgi:hypothetical protein